MLVICMILNGQIVYADSWGGGFSDDTKTSHPITYYRVPQGRTGNTIGVAFIPEGALSSRETDPAVKSIPGLVASMPGIDYVCEHPARSPFFIFEYLSQLAKQGKRVDLLFIGGHQVVDYFPGTTTVNYLEGVSIAGSTFMNTRGAVFNEGDAVKRIETLCNAGKTQLAKDDCKALRLIQQGRRAMAPGAEILYHSCYGGHRDIGLDKLKAIGDLILGGSGGSIVGPRQPVGSYSLKEDASSLTVFLESIRRGVHLKPGDVVVDTDDAHRGVLKPGLTFSRVQIAPQASSAIPDCCSKIKETQILEGSWDRHDSHRVRFEKNGDAYAGYIERLTPLLTNCGFKVGEMTFKVKRISETQFTGQVLWKRVSGAQHDSQWRDVTITVTENRMSDSSTGKWIRVGDVPPGAQP